MASTAERYPIKAKSLTLLELCQSMNDFRNTAPKSTAQILTRRLYLHPLTINNNNIKPHQTKALHHGSPDIDQPHMNDTNKSSRKHRIHRDFTLYSTSIPLLARVHDKLNIATTHTTNTSDDEASANDLETSQTTFSTVTVPIPRIISRKTPSPIKRSVSTRIPQTTNFKRTKSIYIRPSKVDVWGHLATSLERPTPEDPPTTPFDQLTEYHLKSIELNEPEQREPNYNSIQEIKIYKRTYQSNSIIEETENNSDN